VPLNFARLKIAGFKSFVEPTTVEIGPGLSGIVGPNGCGKSNIVEALRWAMGESSAKSMRGGEMEDVIFAGTEARPARNLAEVVISIDNSDRSAPPPLSEEPEIEISRRIERGQGSTYKVNGREWRARDLSTLLADAATGAHSSGLVSQGRVGALIAMKPEARRVLLEEAAGITGLHARRHEAELKLRATEANLARLDDVRTTLETQLAGLKKQARQASRWKNIAKALGETEALLLGIRHARAEFSRASAEAALRDAERAEAEAAAASAAAATEAAEAAAALPALRIAEASAREAAGEARHAAETIEAELRAAEAALADTRRTLEQLLSDFSRETALAADATAAVERLADEAATLADAAADPARLEAAQAAHDEAARAVAVAEAEAARATEAAADIAAKLAALSAERADAESRLSRIAQAEAELARAQAEAEARLVEGAALDAAKARHDAAQATLASARETVEHTERATTVAREKSAEASRAQNAADARAGKLDAETRALSEVLGSRDNDLWPPLVDAVAVPEGLETALGAALGDALDSTADEAAEKFWRVLPALDAAAPLPAEATPLATLVEAPPALARALAQAGLVDDAMQGRALQAQLSPGQVLVTRDGAIFRWDGFSVRAGTPTPAAVRLSQRNRLKALAGELSRARQDAQQARAAHEAAAAAEGAAIVAERAAREARRSAEADLERARGAAQSLAAQATAASGRLAGLTGQAARLAADRADAEAALSRAQNAAAALPPLDAARAAQAEARSRQAEARSREGEARAVLERARAEARARAARAAAVAREQGDWSARAEKSSARLAEITARRGDAEAALAAAETRPPALVEARAAAAETLAAADAARRAAGDALAAAEQYASATARTLHDAEVLAATAREQRARGEGGVAAAAATAYETARAIQDRFQVEPQALLDALAEDASPATPDAEAEEAARGKIERLTRERDGMGPVNLAAEQEADAVEARLAELATERDDLTGAIAKLRGAIGTLNREGRERLSARFNEVDANFRKLFEKLFGGGKAHLALIGSDDPLEAGLEVYASPPGKKLASLALLSGGEQALTALSLIFAVFLCNPAPVCVLDEVDAPLDDANVVRFCDMIESIAQETGTRFLVVTHHRITMARMDRLFGVTMQERGVSRLVSVDLHHAERLAGHRAPSGMAMAAE
jgi:chromosome segregation protein